MKCSEVEYYKWLADMAVDRLMHSYFHSYIAVHPNASDDEADEFAENRTEDECVMSWGELDALLHGEDAYAIYCREEGEVE